MANVFDSPIFGGRADFDASTALGSAAFSTQPATIGTTDATGFAGSLVSGFVSQATRGETSSTGFSGGLISGASAFQAQTGSTSSQGFYPGSQAKQGGLHAYATDADGDPISFDVLTQPVFGTLQVEFNGAFLYAPKRGFSGVDSFTWRPVSNGELGPTYTVLFNVIEDRQALTGEANAQSFAGTLAGSGLFGQALLGETSSTGFASVGLIAGFTRQATRGETDPVGFGGILQGKMQALLGETSSQGFAGVLGISFVKQALLGETSATGFASTNLQKGLFAPALLGQTDSTGFAPSNLDLPHGFTSQAALGQTDSTGFAARELFADHIAQTGIAGDAVGLVPFLNNDKPPLVWSPEPPPVVYYNPLNHLPAGRVLDHPTEDALMLFWASQGYRVLTSAEIETIVGAPLPNPVFRVEFGTGEYPVRMIG